MLSWDKQEHGVLWEYTGLPGKRNMNYLGEKWYGRSGEKGDWEKEGKEVGQRWMFPSEGKHVLGPILHMPVPIDTIDAIQLKKPNKAKQKP